MTLFDKTLLKDRFTDFEKFKDHLEQNSPNHLHYGLINRIKEWLLDDEQKMILGLNPWNFYFLYVAALMVGSDPEDPDAVDKVLKQTQYLKVHDPDQIRILSQILSTVRTPEIDIQGSEDYKQAPINMALIAATLKLGLAIDLKHPLTSNAVYNSHPVKDEISLKAFSDNFEVTFSGPHTFLPGTIRLSVHCSNVIVHQALKQHENRLQKMLHLLNQQVSPRFLFSDVIFEITPRGYSPLDMKFSVDSMAALSLFTGNRLYSNHKVFLRELIQNAVDACNLRRLFEKGLEPHIRIDFDDRNGVISFSDNGIGMDREWMEKYFLKIGISFYQSGDLKNMARNHLDFNFISKFGIGFLSSFLVSDRIVIQTRKQGSPGLLITISNLQEYFDVKYADDDCPYGTRVSLHLKKTRNNYGRNMDYVCYLKTNIRFLSIPVTLNDHEGKTILLGKEKLAYETSSWGNCEFVSRLKFKDAEGYLFLKTKQNLNRFYGLESARGGVSIFQDGIFVMQTDSLLPEGAGQSIIGRINLMGADRCELSMDRNRIFWTEEQLANIKRMIQLGIVDLTNQVTTPKPGLNPEWQIDQGLINNLAVFFDFNEIDDEMYQKLAEPIQQIIAKRFRDFIRIHFAHSGENRSVPDADGYAEAWQKRILKTFEKKSRPALPVT